MCFQRDCCVTECEEGEIPEAWKEQDKLALERREQLCEGEAHVDRRWVARACRLQILRIQRMQAAA